MKKSCFTIALFAATALFFTCSQEFPNPLSNTYKGDYRFTASFVQQPDTFRVFTPYNIEYTVTGIDTFETFRIVASAEDMPDTLSYLLTGSTMQVYFTKPFTGNVRVIGVRPNLKEVAVELPVSVVNPFTISGNPVAKTGQTLSLALQNSTVGVKSVQWYLDTVLMAEKEPSSTFAIKKDTVFTGEAHALVLDSMGNMVSTDTVTVSWSSQTPAVKFPQKSIEVPVGQEVSIAITAQYCDSVVWKIKSSGITNVTAASSPLHVIYTSAGNDTIIAQGKNRSGQTGNKDTIYVRMATFTYIVSAVTDSFPDILQVRKWTGWKVSVKQNGAVMTDGVHYSWLFSPADCSDSLRYNADSSCCYLYAADSIPPFTITVYANVGTDSTNKIYKTVTVREYRPVCTFETAQFTSTINADVSLTVQAADENGSIAAIYYYTSDNKTPVSTGKATSWKVKFATPGSKQVFVYAVDNDGFISDTAVLGGTITASKPYFQRPVIDTAIFISDSVTLAVNGVAGNTGDTIVNYQWDFNNDGNWDSTTITGSLTKYYTTAQLDTIKVGCRNQQGDTAATLAQIVIHVLEGAPVVDSAQCTPLYSYIGGEVNVHVSAHDTNGTISKIAMKINNGTDSIYTVNASKTIDTTITVSIQNAGKYVFSVAVIDDDTVKSAYKAIADSLVVTRGEPVVTGLKPDTVWLKDTNTYTISATDVNGTVKSYLVQWNGSGDYSSYTDSTFKAAFATSGKQTVKLVVIDNDNMSSDTITDSVYVKLGKPIATPAFNDTVYMLKSVSYKLRGADSNGTIKQWAVSWDAGAAFEVTTDSSFIHSYPAEGLKSCRMYVVDDDGIASDTAYM